MNQETIPKKVPEEKKNNPLTPFNKRGFKWKGLFKDWQTVLNLILVVALIIVSVYAYNLRKEKIALEEKLIQKQEIQDQVQNEGMEVEEREVEERMDEEEGIKIFEIKPIGAKEKVCQKIMVEAQKGDGITHLARRGLKKYLEEYGEKKELTKEHKIYIEDYLQNQTGTEYLEIEETRTFSCQLIEEAINKSLELSPGQLKNLEKYSQLVTDL